METKLLQEIHQALGGLPKYWNGDLLLKNELIEDLRSYEESVIETLLSNKLIKDTYSIQLTSSLVFKIEDFISMLRYKSYWDNSYTKYTNEIGLTSENKYLKYNSDVILDFPHKDSVLEGGMTKEELGKKEIYYHTVIAKEEIDTLISPKVLNNAYKYDESGEKKTHKISSDDNLILKGNNLIALYNLREKYTNKIKIVYIDPPYNTGGDSFKYNDRFNHSTWLTFMKNRLEVAASLLCDDGSIWINIGDEEVHYLKVLMDEIMPNGFVANVLWQKRTSPDARVSLGDAHDHILVYSKNAKTFKKNLRMLPLTKEQKDRFTNPDNDPRGPWVSSDFTAQGYRPNQMYTITTPSGKEYTPVDNRCWKNVESEFFKAKKEGRMWFGKNGDAMPRRKTYLFESAGRVAWTWWDNKQVGHNQEAKKESIALFGSESPFSTPKPERLLQQIISLCSDEKDLVLDFFMGSGTTQAVAHKMNRQYIGIEQMDYINQYVTKRLRKVIKGEQGGISEETNWKGGGSFVYAELYSLNEVFLQSILSTQTSEDLQEVLKNMRAYAYLNFKVDLEKVTMENKHFQNLSLKEKKHILIQLLDMNQLYLNYSEIEDSQYCIPDSVKTLNRSFYQKRSDTNE